MSDTSWLDKSTFYNNIVPCNTPKDSIVFSPSEVQYIKKVLLSDKREWDAGNTLDSFNFFPKRYVDSLALIDYEKVPGQGTQRPVDFFYRHFACHILYHIAHPVFLRNNTICIFSWDVESATGNGGHKIIFVKTKNRWQEFYELSGYIEG